MNKPIYFLLQHLKIGGVEICITNIANVLVQRGYKVFLVLTLQDIELSNIDSRIRIIHLTKLHHGDKSIFYKLYRRGVSYVAIRRFIHKLNNTIIVSTRNEYNIMLSKYSNNTNIRIAQLHHDYVGHKGIENDFKLRYLNIDNFLILTDDVKEEIRKMITPYNKHTKLITVPNFISSINMECNSIKPRDNIAIAVGRLSSEKGFLRLLDIWKVALSLSDCNIKLFIVGEGPERNNLEKRIIELGIGSSVTLLGQKSSQEVLHLMYRSKVYCMSSFTEAFPTVLLEAMACRLPQIAFDVRVGPRNIILNDNTGYLVRDNDITTYANHIIRLMNDNIEWQRFSFNSYKRAKDFSVDNVINRWESIFKGEI